MKLRTILVAVLALATMALSSAAGMGQVNPAAAADNLTQKMYWTDAIADRIQRANLDGSGVDNLVTGVDAPLGIALDLGRGKMYWDGRAAASQDSEGEPGRERGGQRGSNL